ICANSLLFAVRKFAQLVYESAPLSCFVPDCATHRNRPNLIIGSISIKADRFGSRSSHFLIGCSTISEHCQSDQRATREWRWLGGRVPHPLTRYRHNLIDLPH